MEVPEELQERYDALSKTYSLPSLSDMNDAFELEDALVREGFVPQHLLRYMRRRIVAILDSWTSYLHSICMPGEQSMILFEESSKFTDEEKEAVIQLIRKIMRLNRMSVITEVEQSEKKDAAFINEAFAEWKKLHEELKPFARKSLSVWESEN